MSANTPARVFDFFLLEDRILLSADGPEAGELPFHADVELLDAAMAQMLQSGASDELFDTHQGDWVDSEPDGRDAKTLFETPTSDASLPLEVVFVDAGVEDAEILLGGLRDTSDDGTQWLVVRLFSDEDGITRITETLGGLTGVDAVHIVSHGDGRGLQLGNTRLDLDSADGYAGDIASWATSLDADADLLIYGCDLAGTDDGRALVDSIAALCDCDVAASDDATGHELLNGDWEFEYQVGTVDAQVAFSQVTQSSWEGILATYTVTSINDSGAGSLRQAIIDANANAGLDTIDFNISGTGTHLITPTTMLPLITEAVYIDATTDDSFAANGNRPAIIIDGVSAGGGDEGFRLSATADGSTIRGFVIRDWGGNAITIQSGSENNLIVGNYIGRLSTDGTDAGAGKGNSGDGVAVQGNNNMIGGSTSADRNVISGNGDEGIDIDPAASGTVIQGNYVGTDATGMIAIGNGQSGVGNWGGILAGGDNTTIGGTNAGEGNLISGNNSWGIIVEGNNNTVQGNLIGTAVDGTTPLGNSGHGVSLSDFGGGTGNVIGGTAANAGNVISANGLDGIAATGASEAAILGNTIFGNTGLGIDLGDDGVTTNDANDVDTGANGLQNFPVLTSAQMISGTDVNIIGSLNAIGSSYYRIEFFASASGDGSGYGEGKRYLGFANVTTDGSGNATINVNLTANVLAGETVSATATKSNVSFNAFTETSEFAQNVSVTNTAPVAADDAYSTSVNTTLNVGPTTTDLANWWQLDEGTGQTAVDSGALGNDATLGATAGADTDDPTWATGYVGSGALTFDGSDDYVTTTSTVLKTASSFTLSAWFQTTTTTAVQHILWEGYSGGNGYGSGPGTAAEAEMGLTVGAYNQANKIVFFLGYDVPANGADPIYIVSNSDFTDTTSFHHAAVTVTDLGGGVFSASLYVDGVLEGTDTGVQNDRSAWGNLQIGKPDANTRLFSGQIDEVRVYDTALSAGQVQDLARSGVLQNDSDLDSRAINVNTALVTGPSYGTLSIESDGSFAYTPNANFNGVDSFSYQTNDGSLDSNVATVTITVNDDPVISTTGGSAAYTENAAPTLIDSGFTATDPYSTDLDSGTLTVSISAGGTSGDQLTVVPGGSVTVVGNTVRYGGVDVATFSGGGSGSDLVITFNANSTPSIAQDIGRQIGFHTTSDNPSTAPRTIDFVLTDGDSGTSNIAQRTVNVSAANDAPEIAGWFDSNWGYRKEILIGAGQVSADLVGFPLLVHLGTDADLASFAQADADDVLFTAGDGTTQLAHEVELFTSATGELFAWVKTDLSASQDTRLYLYYGNAAATNQQDVVNVWDSGFQGVWHLNDSPNGTAGEINDSTANNNDGTTEGTMDASDLVTTKIGTGLDFDEVDDLIRINNSASLDSTASAATIEVWVNWDNVADGNHQILMTSSNRFTGGAQDGYEWASNGSGDHFYYPEGGTDPNYVLGTSPYTNGVWHHVALTQDFSSKQVEIYVDGVAMSFTADTLDTTWTTLADPADWLWGGNPDRAARYFDGMMDEIRVSNLVRSQDWIQASFASQDDPSAFFSLGSAETEHLTLTDINEDDSNPAGDTVASMIASVGGDRITDPDSGTAEGVAVIGVDDTNGTWQYDSGSGWTDFGSVSDSNAVLLDGSAKIRFVPDPDYVGSSGNLTFRAWDTTDGNPSGTTSVDVSTNGDATAYSSATDTANLNVIAVNDAPVEASIEGSTLAYTENDGAVAITSTLALSDVDDTNLESAVVQITGNYANGQDVLTFVDQNGISGVWNSGSGTMTLTGTATVAQYEAALRSITYTNTSDNPSTATRTVAFTVNDGDVDSNTQTRDISIAAINDDPTNAGGLPTDITVTEDVSSNVDLSALSLSDLDDNGGNLTVTLSTSTGGDLSASTGGGVTVGGSGTGTLTLTGSLADLNTFLDTPANVQYLHGTPHTFGNDADTIQVVVNDGGNTGSGGGTDQTIGTVNVDITAVNDEQVLATNTGDTVPEGSVGNTVTTAMLETTDVDNTDSQLVYTVDAVPTNGSLYRLGSALNVSDTFTQADLDAGLITYDHDGSQTSSDSFDFTVDDGAGTTTSSTFNWTVSNVNDAPVEASIEGSTLAYTENGGAVAITSTLALSDVDDTNLESAVVQISGNYASGQDVLTFVDQNGISGVWNAGSGTMTLSGTATVAEYEAALRSITYTNSSDNPSTATRTVSFTVNDGDVDSNTQTRDISIAATNDDPTGAGLPSDITVTEDVSSNVDLSALNLADLDDNGGNLTVTLSTSTGGDLSASTGGGVTVGGSSTGTLTLTGTLADLNTFLDTPANVQYLHGTPHTFGNDADTIQVVVNDGGNTGSGGGTDQTIGTVNVDITAVNDEQVLATNAGDTVAEGSTGNTVTTAMLETTDVDNTDSQLVYTVDVLPSNGTLYRSGVVLNVSDTFTQADIDANLITYDHDGSGTTSDSFDFTVDDGAGTTTSSTFNWTVTAVNDAPVEASIEGSTLAYSENGGAVAITSTLALSDVDDTNLESAVVQISGNYANGQDVLTFVDQNGISGVWNAGSGTMTLTGTATVAQYEAALRSITYTNTSDNPSTATRTVAFTVNDGDVDSNTQTRDISIAATNDDPTGGGLVSDITVTEDVSSNVDLSALNLADPDENGGNLTVTLSTSTGGDLSASTGGGVTVGGSGTGTLTLTGSLADLNTFLDTPANIQYLHGTPHTFGNDADTIQVVVNDGGNTGSGGGTDQTIGTVNVDITAVNDEQVLATNTGDTVPEGSVGNTVTTAMLETTDVDNTDSQLVYTVDAVPTNGTLYRLGSALNVSDTFTQADLDAGLITYDHDGSQTSSDSFDFTVDDGAGTTTSSTFNWTVSNVNDAPVEASIEGSTLAYTENGGAVAITSTLALSDVDDTNLESAVVQISGNYANGQDVLTFVDQNGISGVWNAGSGTMTLTGTATVAQYEAALRSITYTNTSDNPSTATRTVAFTVNDGDVDSNTQTRDISIAATNDDPTGGGLVSDISVTEDVSSNVDLSALNLADPDENGGNLTVTLSTSTGGDLSASTGGGVTVGGSSTGTLTLTGSLADLNTFLDTPANIQYLHGTPHTFGNDADTIQVVVNDGGNTGSGGGTDQTIGTVNVDITAVNDEQVLATNTGDTVPEGSVGNTVTTAMLETTDVDNTDSQLVYTVDAVPTNGTLYRLGSALNVSDTFTQADLDAGLITYDHDGSQTSSDSFDFTVDDGAGTTTSSTFNWTVSNVNDAPVEASIEGSTLAYTENGGAVTITSTLALSDVDDTNLESAVVQISGNYASGQDVLTFVDQNGISGVWNSGSGTMTLTGTATVAQYEAALRSITYTNSSDNPSTLTRTVSFTVNDGDVNSNTQTRDISIAAINDDPTNAGGLPTDITVTEDVSSNVDLSALNLSDLDDNGGNLTVTLSTSTGGDLSASTGGGVTVGGSGTGTLTLTGSLADLNTFLDTPANVQYLHGTPHTFGNDADTIQVVVNDGGNTGSGGGTDQTIGTVNVDITAVNDEQVLATNTGDTVPEGSVGNTVTTAMLETTDVDNTDSQLVYTVDAVPTNGTLYRLGSALNVSDTFTQADLDAGLITYDHDGSQTSSDSFDFTVDDGAGTTTSSTFNWTVSNVNDAPVEASIEGSTLAYTENDGAVAITSTLALSDVDDTNLESAVVQITGNYASGQDVLTFVDQNGISGVWNAGSGTMTLSGTATVAEYEAALRSITYTNSSDNPSTATRTVSFTVNDGDVDSNTQTRDISIAATNDDPTGAGLPSDITVTEDVSSNVDLSALNLADPDENGGNLTVTLSTSTGGDLSASTGGGVTVGGSGTGTLILTGSLADLNTFLDTPANVQYLHGTPNTFGNDADTIQVVVNDGGNTGSGGGTDQTIGTVNVDITAVNDEQVLATNAGDTVAEGSTGNTVTTAMLETTDVDNTDSQLVYTVDVLPSNGTLYRSGVVLNVSDTFTQADIDANLITYDHDGSGTTSDSFDFTVDDGAGTTTSSTFNWTVTAVNDAPVEASIEGSTLAYSENGGAVAITSTLALSDVDDTNLESAVIQITGNYTSGQDELAFVDQNGISGVWNAGSGTMTLTGTATVAQYEAALRSITYTNTSDNPSTATRTVAFTVNDGDVDSNTQTRDISIAATNDDPMGTGLPSDITVTEDVSSNVDLSALSLSDLDGNGGNLTVTLSTSTGGDLSASTGGGVTVGGSGTGTLTLTGSLADLNTFLDTPANVQYLHGTPHTFGNDADTIQVVVNDGGNTGSGGGTDQTIGTVNVDITAVNDEQVLATNTGDTVPEGSVGNTVTTAMLETTDVDNTDSQLVYTVDALPTTGTLYLSGSALNVSDTFTQADLDANLITYDQDGTDTASDSFDFTVDDGAGTTTSSTFTWTITNVNDAPVEASIEGGTLAYTENDGAVAITSTLALSDVDDTNLESAVVQISGNYASGQDVLTFVDQNGISGVWNAGSGTMTLTGTATVAQYEAALRSITYTNSSDNPSTATRTVSFTVNDGDVDSNTQTRDISIAATNDDPTGGGLVSDISVTEDVSSNVDLSALNLSDLDDNGGNLTVTLSTSTGGDLSASTGGGVTVGGSGTGTLTLTGTLADLNTFLDTPANVQYLHGTPHTFGNDIDTIQVVVNDGGNTGSGGGTDQTIGTVNVDITAINDSPTLATNTGMVVAEGSSGAVITPAMLNGADVDDSGAGLIYTITDATDNGALTLSGFGTLGLGATFTQADLDNGDVIYSHDDSETVADAFGFSLADGGEDGAVAVSATFNITVTPVNDNTISAIVDIDLSANSVAEDAGVGDVVGVTALANDGDAADSVAYTLDDDAGGQFAIDGVSGVVTVSGPLDFETAAGANITVRAISTDGSSVTQVISISITDVNEAPTATGESFTVDVGESLSVGASGVIFNDTDIDGDTLAIVLVAGPTNGVFSLDPGGSFTYTPNPGFFGQDSFFYRVTDGALTSNVAQVVIDVPIAAPFAGPSGPLPGDESSPDEIPDLETLNEAESDVESEIEGEDTNEEADAGESTDDGLSSSIVAFTPNPQAQFGGDQRSEHSERVVTEDLPEEFGESEHQRLAAYTTFQNATHFTLSHSPALEQLERLLHQDLQQAIVWTQWDDYEQEEQSPMTVFVGVAGAGMSVFSIGYVFWALRGGALMTVFASSLPAWRFIDPIAMLSAYRSSRVSPDEGLESLLGRGN